MKLYMVEYKLVERLICPQADQFSYLDGFTTKFVLVAGNSKLNSELFAPNPIFNDIIKTKISLIADTVSGLPCGEILVVL